MRGGTPRPAADDRGGRADERGVRIPRGGASTGPPQERISELAARDDWRAAVKALGLPEREARAMRVAVLAARIFGGHSSTRRRRPA
jgi:hypothetical protein